MLHHDFLYKYHVCKEMTSFTVTARYDGRDDGGCICLLTNLALALWVLHN